MYCYYASDYEIMYDEEGDIHTRAGEDEQLTDYNDVTDEYKEYFDDPDIVGHYYSMDLMEVYSHKETYADLISDISDYYFPLRREYMLAKAYLAELKSKYSKKKPTEDDKFLAMLDSK